MNQLKTRKLALFVPASKGSADRLTQMRGTACLTGFCGFSETVLRSPEEQITVFSGPGDPACSLPLSGLRRRICTPTSSGGSLLSAPGPGRRPPFF